MVLVNGAEGIGTGWSTKIPNYNPRDIAENIRYVIMGTLSAGEPGSPLSITATIVRRVGLTGAVDLYCCIIVDYTCTYYTRFTCGCDRCY